MRRLFEYLFTIIIVGILAIVGWVYRQEIWTGIKNFATFLESQKQASVEVEYENAPLFIDDGFTGAGEVKENG